MKHTTLCRLVFALAILAIPAQDLLAQRLPVRTYDVADGLAYNQVLSVYRDSRGYLWVATPEGLSRFDGARFVNYGVADGLPHSLVNALTEDGRGRLWVATNGGGLARLDESGAGGTSRAGAGPFLPVPVSNTAGGQRVNAVLFDRSGTAWCATDDGLYSGSETAGRWTFTRVLGHSEVTASMPGLAHSDGTLWFGLQTELIRVVNGKPAAVPLPSSGDAGDILALAEMPGGDLLVGRARALVRQSRHDGSWSSVPLALEPTQQIRALCPRDDSIWVATSDGLIEWRADRTTRYGVANGLPDQNIRALLFDEFGGLWAGTWTRGLSRLTVRGVVSFTRAEGLSANSVVNVVEGRDGRMYVATEPRGLAAIEGDRVLPVRGGADPRLDSAQRRLFQDSQGRWWIGTDDGLFVAPGPELDLTRARKLGAAEGAEGLSIPDSPNPLVEDADGKVWVSARPNLLLHTVAGSTSALPRLVRLSPLPNLYTRLAFDGRGRLWLSSLEQIGRVEDGAFEIRTDLEGLPERRARAFVTDRDGRLWVGLRYEGLAVADDVSGSPVRFRPVQPAGGFISRSVWCLTTDSAQRVYLGTGRGFDRFDPATGAVTHLTAGVGVAGSIVTACTTDSKGRVWAGTSNGVLRFEPDAGPPGAVPPRVLVTGLTISGEERFVAARGLESLPPLGLAPGSNNIRIEFAGVRVGGTPLRYQYRLDGADDEWSVPTEERSVNYSRLAPGDYRLQVRAVDADGPVATSVATVPFTIETPIWRRWWAIALAGLAVGLAVAAIQRIRLRQVLAMERVRGQIATDLHDEVGSGLSQIAVLNEVAKRDAPPAAAALIGESASVARALRESMSDIVWAVDPRKDTLLDLVQRMRQTTYNLLEVDGLDVRFEAPEAAALEGIGLPPDRRRHLLLILKEAVTNIARHAGARRAAVSLEVSRDRLRLVVEDDGVGTGSGRTDGRGLKNMATRATALGGRLTVEPGSGGGTRVTLEVPLAASRIPRMVV